MENISNILAIELALKDDLLEDAIDEPQDYDTYDEVMDLLYLRTEYGGSRRVGGVRD